MSRSAEPRRGIRLPELASTDRAALDALLDHALVGHFALVADDGTPAVLPTAVIRDGDRVLCHGSTGSRWMRRLASGVPAALAVTSYDGLVVARSAFESSIHYRSAVVFGSCAPVTADKEHVLDLITDRLLPGRVAEVRRPTKAELAATLVLSLPIEDWSLRISDDWPEDEPDDVAGPAWAGVGRPTAGPGPASGHRGASVRPRADRLTARGRQQARAEHRSGGGSAHPHRRTPAVRRALPRAPTHRAAVGSEPCEPDCSPTSPSTRPAFATTGCSRASG